jgi:hypothetical protein
MREATKKTKVKGLVMLKKTKPEHYKSLIKIQYAITYVDSEIRSPIGRLDPLIYSFDVDGQVVQPLPKQFILRMRLEAIEIRDKKSRSRKPLKIIPIMYTGDIMDGGIPFHRHYTKKEIAKMRVEEVKRIKQLEKEMEESKDYDD